MSDDQAAIEAEIEQLIEALPSRWRQSSDPGSAEAEAAEILRRLRARWLRQIALFEQAWREERARYDAAPHSGVQFEPPRREDCVSPRLDALFAQVGRELLTSNDPVKATRRLLGQVHGRPAKAEPDLQEHIDLIDDVRNLVAQGLSQSAALNRVADESVTARDRAKYEDPISVVRERIRKEFYRALASPGVREALAERDLKARALAEGRAVREALASGLTMEQVAKRIAEESEKALSEFLSDAMASQEAAAERRILGAQAAAERRILGAQAAEGRAIEAQAEAERQVFERLLDAAVRAQAKGERQ